MIDLRSIFALWRRNTKIAEILMILLTTNELFTLWNKNRSKITHIFERKKSNYLQLQYHNLFIEILDYIILTKWSHFHDFKSFFKLCKLFELKNLSEFPSQQDFIFVTRDNLQSDHALKADVAFIFRASTGLIVCISSIPGIVYLFDRLNVHTYGRLLSIVTYT